MLIEMVDRRSEHYFATAIGLPNYGLDPSKDCNHVSNEDLRFVFGEKIQNKGYCYEAARSPRVVERVQELYPPCFQTPTMPEDSRIPESFARVVLSEVIFHTQMNWARYAAGRVKSKPLDGDVEPVFYIAHNNRITYIAKVLQLLAEDIQLAEEELQMTSYAHQAALEQLAVHPANQQPFLGESCGIRVLLELRHARCGLSSTITQLEKLRAMTATIERNCNDAIIKFHNNEVEEELKKIADFGEKIRDMEGEAKSPTTETISASEQEVNRLLEAKTEKWEILEKLKEHLKLLEDMSTVPATRTASRYIEGAIIKEKSPRKNIQDCALCKTGFPLFDVVLAPCFCIYHPWCAAMHTSVDKRCAHPTCKKEFASGSLKSFGYYIFEKGPNKADHGGDVGTGDKKRGHLNSDVGGLNYTPKKEKPSQSNRKKSKENSNS